MEAKIDIRKLQLLNDRISQTLDALNQVRLSVHSLQPLGLQGVAQPFGVQPGIGGLGHSSWGQAPSFYPQHAFAQAPVWGQQTPFAPQAQFVPQAPFMTPFVGLNHSTVDPTWMYRVNQIFPYAGLPYSPVASIY